MRLLGICASLALGLVLASLAPACAEAWVLFAVLAAMMLLFGYGFSLPGWHYCFAGLAGLALFLHASVQSERGYRTAPWLRDRVRSESVRSQPLRELRRNLSRRVGIGLMHDRETASLNRAMLLGERNGLSSSAMRRFVDSGTLHIFAISGLHVMIVARVLMVLMLLLFVPLRWAGVVTLPLVWGYVYVIGMTPSAVRAAAMASIYLSAPLFYRRPDGLRSWSLTFIAVHVISPCQIRDIASQLSFAVMLALILDNRFLIPLFTAARHRVLCSALSAWAASVPILAVTFGRVTPGGIIANLMLMSAAAWSIATAVIGLLLSFVSNSLAAHLNNLSALFTRFMVLVADIVARLPFANIEGWYWRAPECVGWYLAMFLSAWLLRSVALRRLRL